MYFRAIACDYDRTLAEDGRVATQTVDALRRARAANHKIILITGRAMGELKTIFSDMSIFHLVVAENGALLFDPALGDEEPLCPSAPPSFQRELRERGVPFTAGTRVIATTRPHEIEVLELVNQMKLELEVSFNRESVMVLPSGVDKGSGLIAALTRLSIAPAEVVGIGDAENDRPFLRLCGFSVAVANAIDSLKEEVDLVTRGCYGAGATEVIDRIIAGTNLR